MLPRDATNDYLERMGRQLDIVFDVDLGELVPRHHVVARGVDLGHEIPVQRWQQELDDRWRGELETEPGEGQSESGIGIVRKLLIEHDKEIVGTRITEPELHYEFVPGLEEGENEGDPFFWYWTLDVSDDADTYYQDSNNGARGLSLGGPATHATRDLGGVIPRSATRLFLRFSPPSGWEPPEPWRRELSIDLETNGLMEVG